MTQKIYKMCWVKRFRDPWYQLSKEEQVNLMAKVQGVLEEAGGKRVVICDANWTNDQLLGFAVEEFPDLEAVQRHTQLLIDLNWLRYIDAESALGTEWQRS